MKYITISNWNRHQHYKDRRPPWIKLEIEIIEEFDADGNVKKFHPMPDSAKLTFICLLCLRAHFNDKIPFKNEKWLKRKLGLKQINLQPLVNAGYISIDSNSVAELAQNCSANVKSDTPERETERETYKKERDICAPEKTRSADIGFLKSFQIFYENYPLKKSREQALKAWKKHKPDLQACINAIKIQKAEKQTLRESNQFCPEWKYPATWINQGCWDDIPIDPETNGQPDPYKSAKKKLQEQGHDV